MNNNVKRFILYLIYVAAFAYLVLMGEDLHRYYQAILSSTFKIPYEWLFISIIFRILFGLLLALPQFIKTYRQEGSWMVDWIVLLTVGFPALCIAISPIMYIPQFAFNVTIGNFLGSHLTLVSMAGTLFGFVLLSSFGKQKTDSYQADVNIM